MSTNIKFLSVAQFKAQTNTTTIEVVKNPNTGKLFMTTENGDKYKVQGDINPALPLAVLVENGNLGEACLVNVKNVDNTVFTL